MSTIYLFVKIWFFSFLTHILQHAHFAEFIEVEPAELYYIGAFGMPGDPAEYHQHDDVCESMAYVSFVGPAKIGHGCAKSISFSMMLPGFTNLFCTFAVWLSAFASIERSWSSGIILFITIWFSTIKLRKNLPLDQIFTPHNLLKIRVIATLVQVPDIGQTLSQDPDMVAEAPALHSQIRQNSIIFENSSQS